MKTSIRLLLGILITLIISCTAKDELPEGVHRVIVQETNNSGGYSYANVSEDGDVYWIAIPETNLSVGDTLYYTISSEMTNFKSPTLNKTFDRILFVDDASTERPDQKKKVPHPKPEGTLKADINLQPVEGGLTIEQVHKDKESLKGKTVKIRGKVTKYNAAILSRNWIHIQDGTSTKDYVDITVTSADTVSLGDIIVVEGTVSIDKDFGSGYTYSVIVEDAKITREK